MLPEEMEMACSKEKGDMYKTDFMVNDELVSLEIPDEETFLRLTHDDEYASIYIHELISQNFLEIPAEGYINIRRIGDNSSVLDLQNVIATEKRTDINSQRTDCEWQEAETKLLLDKYETYLALVGPMKKFKTKKNMWKKISEDIQAILGILKTPLQCENRYKTLLKRKKKNQDNNKTTGASRQSIEYEAELQKIAAIDDSVVPDEIRGIGKSLSKSQMLNKENCSPSCSNDPSEKSETPKSSPKRKRLSDVRMVYLKEKEENKERRHKEKMGIMEELLKILKDKDK